MVIHYNATKESVNKPVADLDSQKKGTEGIEVNCFQVQALNDFKAILNDDSTADIFVKVVLGEERTFFCHKAILSGICEIVNFNSGAGTFNSTATNSRRTLYQFFYFL